MAEKAGVIKKKWRWWKKSDTEYLILSLPTIAWYFCFCYLPLFGVIIAFKTYRISQGSGFLASLLKSPWVALNNFKGLFSNPDLAHIVRITLMYNVVFITLGVVLPVGLALIISELRQKTAAKVYQTIMFLPNFLSWVVVGTLVWAFLGSQNGLINQVLKFFGGTPHNWYGEPRFWPPFLVLLSEWKGIGFGSVIYLAAITSLDKAVYEAAIIDGATKRQQIWYITLPLIKRIVILMLIMSVGGLFNSDFGLFWVVPRESVALYDVTTTTSVLIYKMLKGAAPVGVSAAAAFLQSVISCVLVLLANAVVRKVDNESAMI
ncbi:MAG: ABC transporter permease subunit [Treponema sp.]|jgi:putative aldouronate transport system permease protein|nr:ABC transporter permease subunit [Treponema sp.]